jgi:hypothetical protein
MKNRILATIGLLANLTRVTIERNDNQLKMLLINGIQLEWRLII